MCSLLYRMRRARQNIIERNYVFRERGHRHVTTCDIWVPALPRRDEKMRGEVYVSSLLRD